MLVWLGPSTVDIGNIDVNKILHSICSGNNAIRNGKTRKK